LLIEFLISLLQDFRNANVLTKTTAISALAFFVVAPAGVIAAWYRRGVTRLQEENAELKRECRERRRAEKQLRRDVQGLRPQTIAGLVERVAFERRDGNEERAIALVRSFVDHDAAALGPLCREVAEWHLSMVEGDPPGEHWNAAKRFATLAVHLAPDDHTATALLAEINARMGDAALRAGDIEATRRQWEEAWHWAPAEADNGKLVDELFDRVRKDGDSGDYFRMLAFANRYVTAAMRSFGPGHADTCTALYYQVQALWLLGRNDEALEAVEQLLPVRTDVSGERHFDTLATLHLRADVLQSLGRHDDALRAVDELMPIEIEVRGERHLSALMTRHLRARVLYSLGRVDEALEAAGQLLPIVAEVTGEHSEGTFATREVRGLILRATGEVEAALAEHRTAHEGLAEVLGKRHPKTLHSAAQLGMSLAAHGDTGAAEALLFATQAVQSDVLGVDHPHTLGTALALESLRAQGAAASEAESAVAPSKP
jgi:tetratricopeptide (TPR) repeat protein